MAVLSSMPCPVEGCAVHLRVTATTIDYNAGAPDVALVVVNVDQDGIAHLHSHLVPQPEPTPPTT